MKLYNFFRLGNPARVTEKVQSQTIDMKLIDLNKKLQALEDELSRTNNGSKRHDGKQTSSLQSNIDISYLNFQL